MFGEAILGKGTIDKDAAHITIEIDMMTPEGIQLMEFLEKNPDLASIAFYAMPGFPVNYNKEKN